MAHSKTILYPCDFSANTKKVAAYTAEIADKLGADVIALYVVEDLGRWARTVIPHPSIDQYQKEAEKAAREKMDAFVKKHLAPRVPATPAVMRGDPAEQILQAAREKKVDLMIMGTHGRSGLEHVLFGSVAETVVTRSPVPVLVVTPDRMPG
ncbi:MAG: universal stress protein [Deltaproteobacteria bacterium]|nr:universal stress protein [Deltaproteobacteria bacterium]